MPDERFNALYTIKEYYCRENQQLVILLGENNISLFFALHSLLPEASWLLKNESLDNFFKFIEGADSMPAEKIFFSRSLINYTRQKWHPGFIKLATKYRAPLLPVWIRAHNSALFYASTLLSENLPLPESEYSAPLRFQLATLS